MFFHQMKSESHSVMSNSLQLHGLYSPQNSPGQNTGVGSLSLLQGIFPTQESDSGVPHCRQILYQLNQQGNPRILEWVAYPFSRRSSRPRNQTEFPALQVDSLPAELPGKILVQGRECNRRRQWHPTPVLLPGKSHGWRSWVGCSPWGC